MGDPLLRFFAAVQSGAIVAAMSEIMRIMSQIEQSDSGAAEKLLLQVHKELRGQTAAKLSKEEVDRRFR
jgi:hypothetical protein